MSTVETHTHDEAWTGAREYLNARLNQPHATSSHATLDAENDFTIPVISLAQPKEAIATQIHTACTTIGFFYLTAHPIPQSTTADILHQARRFFHDLSSESKNALHVQKSPYYYGYEPSASTTIHGDAETKQAFNFGYADSLDPHGSDGQYVQIDGTRVADANVWPSEAELPGFYEGVRKYYGEVLSLARTLMELFALSLGMEEKAFEGLVGHPGGNGRLMHYPAARSKAKGDGEGVGLGAHSDYQCFTILFSSGTPGLEILSPTGEWAEAPVVEGGLIVNVGDFMMRFTNDAYKSTVHRVVNRAGQERYSVPFFFSVNHDQVVETLPSCVSDKFPAKYPPIKAGEYILKRLAMTMPDRGAY